MAFQITGKCNGCGACSRICPVGAISGEKKKVHKVDERQCIECSACGKVCSQGAVQDRFGVIRKMEKRALWRKPVFTHERCMSCTICVEACPVNCLALSQQRGPSDPHTYPFLKDEKACTGCGFCSIECPVGSVRMEVPDQSAP